MCSPLLAQGIGIAFSAASQIYSGMQQSAAHKAQAAQYRIQRIESKTRTMQESRDRFQEFSELESANSAAIAASGLSADSFGALTEGNRRDALEDAGRIEAQGRIEDRRLRFAAKQQRQAARGAIIGGFLGAATTIGTGAADIYGQWPGEREVGGNKSNSTKSKKSLVNFGT